MLTRREKAYISSYSQTVSLSPAISSQFTLGVCTAASNKTIMRLKGVRKFEVFVKKNPWT